MEVDLEEMNETAAQQFGLYNVQWYMRHHTDSKRLTYNETVISGMRYTRSIKMDTSEKSTLFILELSNPS
jgi:hypothetical protein